jgi:hypothetical protein
MADIALNNLNQQLQPIYSNLTNLQGVQLNTISKQKDLMNIVDYEQDRLQEKEDSINHAAENQKRIIYFNDNNRKVSSAYLNIVITITVVLAIIYIVRVIHNIYGSFIPDSVFEILVIMAVSIGLIIIYNLYIGIISRDNYNFDELKLNAPIIGVPNSTSSGSLGFGGLVGCIGSQCCTPSTEDTPGTIWDTGKGRCVFSPASSVAHYAPEPNYASVNLPTDS